MNRDTLRHLSRLAQVRTSKVVLPATKNVTGIHIFTPEADEIFSEFFRQNPSLIRGYLEGDHHHQWVTFSPPFEFWEQAEDAEAALLREFQVKR